MCACVAHTLALPACRQGSYYMLGLPFSLVQGREFVAWRQLAPGLLELAVRDVDRAAVS